MRSLCFMSLGLLLAAGCADTAEDYEVNKPVISEPAEETPAAQPDTDVDVDADLNDSDATDSTAPDATDADSATSGATEDDAATDKTQPIIP